MAENEITKAASPSALLQLLIYKESSPCPSLSSYPTVVCIAGKSQDTDTIQEILLEMDSKY